MVRMILGITASVFLGLVVGAVLAGPMGAILGVVLGGVFFMLWKSVDNPASHAATRDESAKRERHDALCIPRGKNAECVFLRDGHTGRFLDVVECSLFPDRTHVDCHKRCLKMMNDGV